MIRLAIVEDDTLYVKQLNEYMASYEKEKKQSFSITVFRDGEDIVENYKAEFDIILMDIQMQFMDGMSAAQMIRERDKGVIIIFITNMINYAVKGYEVDALDYIVKPITYSTFSQKLTRAIDRIHKDDTHYIMIPISGGMHKVDIAGVLYIESQSHTMYYHLPHGTLTSKGRLEDLEKELENFGFYRSNKGYLVNLYHVDGVRDGCCVINGEMLPISRRKKAEFMEKLSNIL